ncbi:Hsp70 family protein [Streptomyces sp. G45]|uniref:Hsp70 family protein n=1 Tax=Streptomyces sp. G45 TaxID=3406627 RepID=UPI003C26140B
MTAAVAGATDGTAEDRVSLGVDFGATGVRAVFSAPGQPVRRLDLPVGDWPWLVPAPAPAGVLPYLFPSLKSLLGGGGSVPWRGRTASADAVAAGLLRELRERVEARAPGPVAQTVISVPAAYQSAQRQALRDAAHRAGLAPVRLISDSLAAVLGHTTDRDSGTFLVFGLGYEGFEAGLVRGVRGHYRALGYDGAATSCGRAFDEATLAAGVRLLRARRGPAAVTGGAPERWLALRERAQEARESLSGAERAGAAGAEAATLTLDVGPGPGLRMRITRENLDAFLEPHVRRMLRRVHALLTESALGRPDVDTLLLVGGGTRTRVVRSGVAGLGCRTVHGPAELLALGALKHAVRLAGGASPSGQGALDEGPLEAADPGTDTLGDAPSLTATLLGPDEPQGAPRRDVAQARELAGQGRRQEAVALLRDIVAEAGELLAGLTGEGAGGDAGGGPGGGSGAGPGGGSGSAPGGGAGGRAAEGAGAEPRGLGERLGQGLGERPAAEGTGVSRPEGAGAPRPEGAGERPGAGAGERPAGSAGKPTGAGGEGAGTGPGGGGETGPWAGGAWRQLARAKALLDLGRYELAVQASHAAWQEATAHPAHAEVLDAMIDVHCAAAMADMAPDHFPAAERWLRCAYGHDPTNVRVRGLLAQRTYRHAEELHRRGARDEAIEALGKCLTWDPEHPQAEALLTRLGRGARNRRGRGGVLD